METLPSLVPSGIQISQVTTGSSAPAELHLEVLDHTSEHADEYASAMLQAMCEAPESFGYALPARQELYADVLCEDAEVVVARDRDQSIRGGITAIRAIPGTVELVGLFRHNDVGQQGVGRRLLLTAIMRSRDSGAHRIELAVMPSNDAALRLYRRAGFAQAGKQYNVQHPIRMMLLGEAAINAAIVRLTDNT